MRSKGWYLINDMNLTITTCRALIHRLYGHVGPKKRHKTIRGVGVDVFWEDMLLCWWKEVFSEAVSEGLTFCVSSWLQRLQRIISMFKKETSGTSGQIRRQLSGLWDKSELTWGETLFPVFPCVFAGEDGGGTCLFWCHSTWWCEDEEGKC